MDILPRRAQELNDIPALLANRNMIIDSEAKAQADTRVLLTNGINAINQQFEESDRIQNETRDLINQGAATTELLSGLEESGFFNNSTTNTRRI